MLVKVKSALNSGLDTVAIDVEVNIQKKGLPGFDIVGMASKAVSESKQRVKAAFFNSKIEFPNAKIMINLAPGDIPKEGSFYDLPIAVGLLRALIDFEMPEDSLFFGELSLDGSLRHTKGTLLLALYAREQNIKKIFVPKASANEAAIIKGVDVYPIESISQLMAYFLGEIELKPADYVENIDIQKIETEFDMSEVIGQEQAKRAMEIAAAGGHNFLMVGSPGSGKTMLARAIPGILPNMEELESLEVTKIYSVSGMIPPEGSVIRVRPFRAPHNNISSVGLIGGGSKPQPGEISLAHRGVLFLDEFNEFPRSAIEALRQPMEDGILTISRSRERVSYPARFMLVASANPCPCGYLYDPKKVCSCSEREIERYRKKVSGPIMDRIDLHVDVPVVDIEDLSESVGTHGGASLERSSVIRGRVALARLIQYKRYAQEKIHTNAEMKNKHIKKYCDLDKDVSDLLRNAAKAFELSARSYFKMIKIARTIADLAGDEKISMTHMAEALQYRPKIETKEIPQPMAAN